MTRLLVALLSCSLSVFAATCTQTATGAVLLTTAIWDCGHRPTTSDTAVISAATSFTVDADWTFGTSPSTDATVLTVNVPMTFGAHNVSIRGRVVQATTQITWAAGANIALDDSVATGSPQYTWETGVAQNIASTATSSQHVTFNGNPNGGAKNSYINGITNATAYIYDGTASAPATYIDFVNCGDSASGCITGSYFGGGVYMDHATFTTSGPLLLSHLRHDSAYACTQCTWTGALGNSDVYGTSGEDAPDNGIIRSFAGAVFDKRFNDIDGACTPAGFWLGADFTGSYFANSFCMLSGTAAGWTFADVIVVWTSGDHSPYPLGGSWTGGYTFLNLVQDNPHMWTLNGAANSAVSGIVVDIPEDVTSDSGEVWVENAFTTTVTANVTNNVLLGSKTGFSNAEWLSTTPSAPNNASAINFTHNTWVGGTHAGSPFGALDVNEGGAASFPVTTLLSNLTYGAGPYYMVWSVGTTAILNQSVTTADYNSKTSNVLLTQTCGACTNQGRGYASSWNTTPGPHDITVSPNLADTARNIQLWDTKYLGHAAGQQWLTSTSYTVGQIISDHNANVYDNAVINYRCTSNHTSGAATEPNVGTSWRTVWEPAGLYDMRQAIASQTMYTDGAINCAACSPVKALDNWVLAGQVPQAPALWKSGNDGLDIGAVDMPVVKHIPPPVLIP